MMQSSVKRNTAWYGLKAFLLPFMYAFTSGFCVLAQSNTEISTSDDTTEIKIAIDSFKRLYNPNTAITKFQQILPLALYIERKDLVLDIIDGLMGRYMQKCDYNTAAAYARMALNFCSSAYDSARAYNMIGNANLLMGSYLIASEYYFSALRLLQPGNAKNDAKIASIYCNLGVLNLKIRRYENAISYFSFAEKYDRKNDKKHGLGIALIDKGECYTRMHHPDSIRKYFDELLRLSKDLDEPGLAANGYEEVGISYIESGNYELAVKNLQKSIEISGANEVFIVIDASYFLADAWRHQKKYREAEELALKALHQAQQGHVTDNISDGYRILINIFKDTKQSEKALAYTDTLMQLHDSIENIEKTQDIDQLDVRYKISEKNKLLTQKELMIARQRNNLASKNLWIVGGGAGIIVLSLVFAGIFFTNRHKQRLQREQIKLLERENKIGLLSATASAEENERGRIAKELHDGVGGSLAAAIMRFSTLHHTNSEINHNTAYTEGMQILNEIGDEIRKTAHNLMPEVLLKQRLPEAIQNYCGYVQEGSGLHIDLQCFGDFGNLSEKFKLNLYRIVQELLKNIVQHAHAKNVFVQLNGNEDLITLCIEDDGIGFDLRSMKTGMGLDSVKARVNSINGALNIDSVVNRGTSVFISIQTEIKGNFVDELQAS